MTWTIEFARQALKDLKKSTPAEIQCLADFLDDLENMDDARSTGNPMQDAPRGRWRYRVGDYRIIVRIHDQENVISVERFGHRKNIYE